jgi:hypothetical protein
LRSTELGGQPPKPGWVYAKLALGQGFVANIKRALAPLILR